jgi:hypothetical protein
LNSYFCRIWVNLSILMVEFLVIRLPDKKKNIILVLLNKKYNVYLFCSKGLVRPPLIFVLFLFFLYIYLWAFDRGLESTGGANLVGMSSVLFDVLMLLVYKKKIICNEYLLVNDMNLNFLLKNTYKWVRFFTSTIYILSF